MLLPLPGSEDMARRLSPLLGAGIAAADFHRFPDGEWRVRFGSAMAGEPLLIVAALDRPDEKFLPILFAAMSAREFGASSVGLICPYLAYMRQDARFAPGQAVTAPLFARLLSDRFDWLVTADPHLHRIKSLDEIYRIPTRVVHATEAMGRWIAAEIEAPLLIGPDRESRQWVAAVAAAARAPYAVLEKERHGDADVSVMPTELAQWRGHTPVLVDDIISTGATMAATCRLLAAEGMRSPICVGIHAVFANGAYETLSQLAARIVTCNTIRHASNAIDVSPLLAEAVRALSQ
jgi:ribose-phosphate pyrophosphokinase